MTKKAQMEAFGLAMVVVLLALGMFFFVKFGVSSGQSSDTLGFQKKQAANDFLNTLLYSRAGCTGSVTFARLIDDMEYPADSSLICPGGSLDEWFILAANDIFSKTFDVLYYKYRLNITFPPGAERTDIAINHNCTGDYEETARYPISGDYGDIYVLLTICY